MDPILLVVRRHYLLIIKTHPLVSGIRIKLGTQDCQGTPNLPAGKTIEIERGPRSTENIAFIFYFYFLKFYLLIFRERGREEEREGEKHQCVVVSHTAPTGGLARSPGMCPD